MYHKREHYLLILSIISTVFIMLYLSFVIAANCWTYTSSTCTAAAGCKWRNDSWSTSGWCEDLNCWSLYSQSECTSNIVPGKNCSWQGGQTNYFCEKISCWSLSGTNTTSCENNSRGLNCQWSGYCYMDNYVSGVNCWNYSTKGTCKNVTGCKWGQCTEKGCWSYSSAGTCAVAKDPWNGKNCTWDLDGSYCTNAGCWKYYQNQSVCGNASELGLGLNCQWKWDSCQDVDCWSYDFTNETACVNNTYNLSCSWNQGSYCGKKDCWSYASESACLNRSECNWKAYTSSGWCKEVDCFNWDHWSGGSESACLQNASIFNLNCVWQNATAQNTSGWCYKNYTTSITTCANKTTERDCLDTYYCWWQFSDLSNAAGGGVCKEPTSMNYTTNATTMFNDWNPGCYVFDMNSSDCKNVTGCTYSSGKCISADDDYGRNITALGLNCSYINNSQLCNALPVLSSCCVWQAGVCTPNKLSTACRDQVQQKSESSCEDAKTSTRCDQIAGSPWYMPCSWTNSTSTCDFKASDVFGANVSYSLMIIDNKMSCQAAGGKWITENYCEGNVSVPLGRCEYKFDEEDNCDKACFACENKDSSGNTVNASNAASACAGSKLGFCEFQSSTGAPNGVGYCKAKNQFKKGIAGDCDLVCGDCTFKGSVTSNDTTKRPSYYCVTSKANSEGGGCKWVTDNSTLSGGYCVNKGEKTCEDACDRCKTQTTCSNNGRTSISNQTGSCKWQTATSSCVANVEGDVEICWDGVDNNNNGLVDCADAACFADSFCGLVSGDCFGWTTNESCVLHNASCEWVIDKWGSFCDFKGSQCWKYNQNYSVCNARSNCQWNNGTGGSSWCEKDWSIGEACMGLGQTACWDAAGSGCAWANDTWCNGTGAGTDWCLTFGGWCEHSAFKPANCWAYSGSTACNSQSGCSWKADQYGSPHCEVNWSVNCAMYYSNATCSEQTNCYWDTPPGALGWCMTKSSKCGSYLASECASALGGSCHWQTWTGGAGGACESICWSQSSNTAETCSASPTCVWKAESGWCEESANCANYDETGCLNATGVAAKCRWKSPGWCDPKGGGFSSTATMTGGGVGNAVGADCYKYDNNRTQCTNKTIINISCGWTINNNPTCDVNWAADCWKYVSIDDGCTSDNGCWWNSGAGTGWCSNIMDQCWSNTTYSSWSNADGWNGNCTENYLCTNNSWGGCEPKCFSLTSTSCINATYTGKCKWNAGWCNSKGMNEMFDNMQAGAPAPLGQDSCNEAGIQKSVDICGFGMKDTGDSYGVGAGVADFSNSSVCNKEKLSSFVMGMVAGAAGFGGASVGISAAPPVQMGMTNFGTERTGAGNDTIIYFVYLDTDGSTSGGCTRSNADNSTGAGYEFKFRYASVWNVTLDKAVETFNSYECKDSSWKASDLKISAWKKMMCSDIGGPMIAIKKADLGKYPTLYDSTKDMRVYVMTIGNTGNVSVPSDGAGPGWATPGSVDFEIASAFAYGADTAKFEDILKKGFVQGEDCFNSVDDDNDGNIDCNDWDCQYSSKCSGLGVNAAGYSDTSSPLVTGVKIEEYPDGALIMYDTNKPTNGTLELYGYGDTQCLNKTDIIYDVGILKNSTVRMYKMWHTAMIYETIEVINRGDVSLNASIKWPLVAGSTYNYKIKVCDSAGKCSISRCSNFTTPVSASKCAYCNFVTRIKAPTGWKVSYDTNMDGTYEHVQGEVCGVNAGMKTNYTIGRKVNVKLSVSDGSTYIEFLNATLTKSGLNDKVRTISTSGDIIRDASTGLVGLTSETRDKIINSLHPEVCKVKIQVVSGGTCDKLYHCDDSGANCVDRTAAAGGAPIDAANCIWNVPYCEFSAYKTSGSSGSSTTSSGGGGGGGTAASVVISLGELTGSKIKEIAVNSQIKFNMSGIEHKLILTSLTNTSATITIQSVLQTFIFAIGDVKNVDLNEDDASEIAVKLDSINAISKKATFNITKLSGTTAVVPSASEEEKEAERVAEEEAAAGTSEEGKIGTSSWIVIGIVAVLVVVIVAYLIKNSGKRRR